MTVGHVRVSFNNFAHKQTGMCLFSDTSPFSIIEESIIVLTSAQNLGVRAHSYKQDE